MNQASFGPVPPGARSRCAIYARVSTGQQDSTNQVRQLEAYAQARQWPVVSIYQDIDTGSKASRTQLTAMMAAASRREFDVVIWWSIDRLTREGVAATFSYLARLRSYGVQYIDLQNPLISSTGPEAEITLAIAAVMARIERERISTRTRAGLARVRAQGKQLGRPRAIIDNQRAHDLIATGKTVAAAAAILGCSRQTLQRRLRSKKLT